MIVMSDDDVMGVELPIPLLELSAVICLVMKLVVAVLLVVRGGTVSETNEALVNR